MKRTILGITAVSAVLATGPLQAQFTLQILHASDLEGGVEAIERAPNFAALVEYFEANPTSGTDTVASVNGTVILSAGDNYIPGPFFNAADFIDADALLIPVFDDLFGASFGTEIETRPGAIDITIMNVIGFDASAVGNHEFDLGTENFRDLIEEEFSFPIIITEVEWPGANFPYLSVNLDFSGDSNLGGVATTAVLPQEDFQFDASNLTKFPSAQGNSTKIAPATIITVDGEEILVIGATTQIVGSISSTGGVTVVGPTSDDMAALAALIQPIIDANAATIDKVIVVSHLQQLALEQQLALLLDDVDVIIAGGSDTLLANPSDPLNAGDTPAGSYPFLTTDLDGDPVAIVSTDGEYSYVGRLVIEFDASGKIVTVDGASGVTGTEDPVNLTNLGIAVAPFAPGSKAETVETLVDSVTTVVNTQDGNVFGWAAVFLEGRRELVRTEETNLGNLAADAALWRAKQQYPDTVACIRNGGGLRAPIGSINQVGDETIFGITEINPAVGKLAGQISELDIANVMRFNNQLVTLTLSGQDLIDILNHGIAATAPGNTPGQFPQVGGLQFSYMPGSPAMVESVALINATGDVTRTLYKNGVFTDPSIATEEFRIVTLNFLAGSIFNGTTGTTTFDKPLGGDNYPFPGLGSDPQTVFTGTPGSFAAVGEQQATQQYFATFFPTAELAYSEPERPAQQDARIQDIGNARADAESIGLNIPVIPAGGVVLEPIATYETGIFDESAAEIVSYDPLTQRLFAISSAGNEVLVIDPNSNIGTAGTGLILLDDAAPSIPAPAAPAPNSWNPNSVDVANGVVYVCWASTDASGDNTGLPGIVSAYDTTTLLPIGSPIQVGSLPDMLVVTPDGSKIVVCNEGEQVGLLNPEGSISIIDISGGFASATVKTADFNRFDRRASLLRSSGVLLTGLATGNAATVSEDLEPEFAVVTPDSRYAWVALQEANAMAFVDLNLGIVRNVLPLGLINRNQPQFSLDVTNSDDQINLINVASLFSPRQPDSIALVVGPNGIPYVLTADEGDSRSDFFDEEIRVRDIGSAGEPTFDPAFNFAPFANEAEFQDNLNMGRLNFNKVASDLDGNGTIDAIINYGGRTMSVFEASPFRRFRLVATTENDFEAYTASLFGTVFNSNNDDNDSFDSRSDDKAGEPEALAVGTTNGRTYAFVGLERQSAILVYDVTDPRFPQFQSYNSNRNFMVDADTPEAGDLGPESIEFIPAAVSPTGTDIIAVANEVSGTVTLWELTQGVQ